MSPTAKAMGHPSNPQSAIRNPQSPVADIIHFTGRGSLSAAAMDANELPGLVRGGAFLWFESAGTDAAFTASARAVLVRLSKTLGARVTEVPPDHPMFTGKVSAGITPVPFRPNRWGRKSLSAPTPMMHGIEHDGRWVALLTPFNLLATAAGHHLYEVPAYGRDESAAMFKNLLLWRYAEVTGDTNRTTRSRAIAKRSPDRLIAAAKTYIENEAFSMAAASIQAIESLAPTAKAMGHPPVLRPIRAAFRDKLLAAFRAARREGRTDDGRRLADLLLEFFPDDAEVMEAAQPVRRSRDREGAGSVNQPVTTRSLMVAAPLPVELSTVVVSLEDHTTDARTLLTTWFGLEQELTVIEDERASYRAQWEALDARARELIRARARRSRDGSGGSRGGVEFDEIGSQRKVIQAKAKDAEARAKALAARMNRITAALRPSLKIIAGYGLELRAGRWVKAQDE